MKSTHSFTLFLTAMVIAGTLLSVSGCGSKPASEPSSAPSASASVSSFSLPKGFPLPDVGKQTLNAQRGTTSWVLSYTFTSAADQNKAVSALEAGHYSQYGKGESNGITSYAFTNGQYIVTLQLSKKGNDFVADYAVSKQPVFSATPSAKK